MKGVIIILVYMLLAIPQITMAQLHSFSFEQLDSLQEVEERPIAVFIHTDWCKYCNAMLNTTFKSEAVQISLNQSFYYVELNAENKNEIRFRNRVFKFKPTGNDLGIHELAEQLAMLNGRVNYPTMCFLNSDFEIVFQYSEFVDAGKMIEGLNELLNEN